MERYELTDDVWSRVADLLPGRPGQPGRHADNRRFLNAVVWMGRVGGPWRALPKEFGNWNSVFQRFNRWAKEGVWERIAKAVQVPNLKSLLLDSTTVRAHQHAAGAQKKRDHRHSVEAVADSPASCT